MDNKKIIEALNKTLENEMGSYVQLITQSMIFQGLESSYLKPMFEKMAQESLTHASILRERIFFLGGMPSMELGERKVGKDTKEVIEINLKQHKETIDEYRRLMAIVPQQEGSKLFETLEHILETEYDDYENFQRLAGKIQTGS